MKKFILPLLFICMLPLFGRTQTGWNPKEVIIQGKVLNFEKHRDHHQIGVTFRNIISRELQDRYVAEIDEKGNFEFKLWLPYPQDFF